MIYTVKKGLHKELRVQGMRLSLFYLWLGIGAFLGFLSVFMILQLSQANSSVSFMGFVFFLLTGIGLFLFLKILFSNISKPQKRKDGTRISSISNKDLLNLLYDEKPLHRGTLSHTRH